ncbi:uncharacterized protein METZ01_LOCUS362150, partial [marine metagenome]
RLRRGRRLQRDTRPDEGALQRPVRRGSLQRSRSWQRRRGRGPEGNCGTTKL